MHSMHRWLCRRSDASIRQTCQNKANPQQADLEKQSRVPYPKEAEKKSRKGQQTRRQELGPELIERLEKLEEKIDAFIVCQFSTPRSILSIGDDTLDVQATCGAEGRTEGRSQMPSEEVGTHSQKELLVKSQDEKDQGSRQHVHQCVPVAAEIDSLIKSNKKLSATIDALGSSGLIDLIEMLSYSIERLQSEIASLHQQNDIICSEKTPRTSHEDSNGKQLGLQVHVTQRLATLLGRRDEELKQEKKATEKYKETIEGLEEMIKVLGLEWERAVPLITHSERTNRGRVSSKEDD